MRNRIVGAAALSLAVAPAAIAQDGTSGEEIFERSCAVCHQSDGSGDPPTFPALTGNETLGDLETVITTIHEGRGNMPPFPQLDADQLVAVASYIRTAWDNEFGEVAEDEVVSILAGIEVVAETASIWDGVYTEEQAERGAQAYSGSCNTCHGRRLNGAADDPDQQPGPPLARAPFLRKWNGETLASLFEYTRTTMPLSNPGYMSDEQYIDIIAYMLSVSDAPPGDGELQPDPQALARVTIEPEPEE